MHSLFYANIHNLLHFGKYHKRATRGSSFLFLTKLSAYYNLLKWLRARDSFLTMLSIYDIIEMNKSPKEDLT